MPAEKYQLSVITPAGRVFEGRIDSLVACGALGSFGVLARHIPMVSALRNGPLSVSAGGTVMHFAVSSGVLEVNHRRNVMVLADFAEKSSSLDEAKAKSKRLGVDLIGAQKPE